MKEKEFKNILFVCSANKQRSKTAEDYFSTKFAGLHHFNSAGTNLKICNKEGTNPINQEFLDWADLILVMEKRHKELILSSFSKKHGSKIKTLAIPDRFKYYQKELIELLENKVEVFLT